MIKIKKHVSLLLAIMVFIFSLVMPFNKADAAGFADVPGYADEAFKAMLQGVMVVGGAAAQANEYVVDNLQAIVRGAGLTYEQLEPHAKEAFNTALSATGDGVIATGEMIDAFLGSAELPDGAPPILGTNFSLSSTLLVATFNQEATFTRKSGTTFTLSSWQIRIAEAYNSAHTTIGVYSGGREYQSGTLSNQKFSGVVSGVANTLTFQQARSYLTSISAITSVVLTGDLPTGQLDNIRDRLDSIRDSDRSIRLGVPAGTLVEPWANTATGAQRAYYDAEQDLWTLPDGVPIPRDQINLRSRGQAMYGDTPVVVGADGGLYDLRTGEKVAGRDEAQAGAIPIPRTVEDEWAFQDTLTKNPAKEETKDDTTTKPVDLSGFFAKLWEWLQKILNAILAIPKAIIDALKALLLLLFVPTDGFWTDNFSELRLALTDKLGADELIEEVENLGSAGGGSFTDVTVSLLGVSGLTVIDADSVNGVLDYIHKWVRGVVFPFLLFYNINQLYKLIRGTSLVEATRNMNRVKGD